MWQNTTGWYMKESNTLAGNVTTKQLQSPILLNTTGQYMKESNTHADNVENSLLASHFLVNTKELYMKEPSLPETGRHKWLISVSTTKIRL